MRIGNKCIENRFKSDTKHTSLVLLLISLNCYIDWMLTTQQKVYGKKFEILLNSVTVIVPEILKMFWI